MSHQLSRGVRLSQTLAPFGVGAIYDLRGESLIACDTYLWKNQGQVIHSRRLAEALGVEGFRSAPASTSLYGAGHAHLPYHRFPQWLFCPTCRALTRWSISKEVKDEPPRCASCARRPQLVPMRFVMACEQGHLGDVPWAFWAHFGAREPKQKGCKDHEHLRFIALAGSGAGLQSLRIECKTCGVKRALAGITSKDTVKAMGLRCSGKQPWEYLEGNKGACDETPVILQRGASNVYFSSIRSALDIPPESTYQEFGQLTLQVTNHDFWVAIRSAPNGPMAEHAVQTIAEDVGCSEEQVRLIMRQELGEKKPPRQSAAGNADLETDEWLAFITPQGEQSERSTFLTRHVPLFTKAEPPKPGSALGLLGQLIEKVVLATKLREVRALVGFSRYNAAGPLVKPDLGRGVKWLPAIEVFGEGIFFSLNEERLREWEATPKVDTLGRKLEQRRQKHFIGSRLKPATPRFVLLHTLAHVLIRQLSFQCGYSSASLRERVYAGKGADGEPQAGILIYTAAGDVEGTLGGLVRQGTSPLLAHTLLSALERASWCSSDPICRESPGQGFGALNLGACHACALVSETSCENANVLLDRGLLVGIPGGVPGFFAEILAAAHRDSARANTLEADE
ncbi:DUF1998 domain-containing protein [Pyxidicoccus xibeiensis]|uniref:DUF1998 domain-containing protein n=1 Tax=Pyxidicoccus xibeiensis TaxID=2906759 RepID=UPI0020A776C2|nr:DUF1998 domain-containing protein [Pyxidicoccus xibeiensis]MCP3138688.1 DUF1998 domain-containing protein [Pyxidicoccus xibeiensis]